MSPELTLIRNVVLAAGAGGLVGYRLANKQKALSAALGAALVVMLYTATQEKVTA